MHGDETILPRACTLLGMLLLSHMGATDDFPQPRQPSQPKNECTRRVLRVFRLDFFFALNSFVSFFF